jgi:hypothetical protein
MTAKERKEQLLNNTISNEQPTKNTLPNLQKSVKPNGFTIPETARFTIDNILTKRIDLTVKVPKIVPTVFIGGSRFAVKGDISMISGKPKSGKSTITKMVLATALMKEKPQDFDSLSILSNYCEGKPVIYIDTEQNPSDTLDFYNEVLNMSGTAKNPPSNFYVLNWRDFDYSECLEHLVSIFEHLKDIYMIVIDGITDLIPSSNDETSSVMLIRYLMRESTVRNTCIIALIHENGESGKMRGHIGAEAARKCQGTISIRYDEAKKVRIIKPLFLRKGKMFDEIYWDSTDGVPRSVSAELVEQIKAQNQLEDKRAIECKDILDKIYQNSNGLGLQLSELMKFIKTYQPTKDKESADACRKRMKRYFESMLKLELIECKEELYYYTQGTQAELFNQD